MSKTDVYAFDWADLAFKSKSTLNNLTAVFVAAPRELSAKRFTQLIKTYLPKAPFVIGFAKEDYVLGFEGQPQFRMLHKPSVQSIIDKVNASSSAHKIYTLSYFQRELPFLLEKLDFKKVLLINGSWHHVFHSSPSYHILTSRRIAYEMLSPFTDEDEAKAYEKKTEDEIIEQLGRIDRIKDFTEKELLNIAARSATRSFDYGFQTGLALAKPVPGKSGKYKLLLSTFNKVVPFQTYAMHYGATQEKNFSPVNDLNFYDTVHAEVCILIEAQKNKQDLRDTVLCINLMPCPSCARMLSQTDIAEFVYIIDHSDGYAVQLLEKAGKVVRRLV